MNEQDRKWVDALKPYWGGGLVPTWKLADGSVDAAKTLDWLMAAFGVEKVKNG